MSAIIGTIHDPLSINLRRQTRLLLQSTPLASGYAADLNENVPIDELLATLSRLLVNSSLTQIIATLYRPILLDLCAHLLDWGDEKEQHLQALCLLVEVHEELFPVLYRLLKSSFPDGPLAFVTAAPLPLSFNAVRLQQLLLAYYRILQANRELPGTLQWSLAPLSQLIWTPNFDNAVRLLSIRCYALQSGMGEAEREKMEEEVFGEICGVDCQMEYGTNNQIDGWIMPVIELKRVRQEREAILTQPSDFFQTQHDEAFEPIQAMHLSRHLVNVHGILFLRSPGVQNTASSLIETATSIDALQSLALHISLRLPTLLTSSPSAGKSLLLSHLAGLLHPGEKTQIITIQLADTSLDPRALLGSYVSSPMRPGTFDWKEGVLVRSMRQGKWVIFKDVDRGSNEVLGVLKPLIESMGPEKWIGGRAFIDVPSRGRVFAHNDFMVFATRSCLPSRSGKFPNASFFGAHKFYEVTIQLPSPTELHSIINARFSKLAGDPAKAIIAMWEAVREVGSVASARDIGLRELEKFCSRVERLLPSSAWFKDISQNGRFLSLAELFPNPSLREDMYLEARDVFFGAGTLNASTSVHTENISSIIGKYLELEQERRDWVLQGRTPDFNVEKDANGKIKAVYAGRARLLACVDKLDFSSPTVRPFAMHRLAVMLLSRIATAVTLGEPVLLTGETGTGKTSVITYLASLLHRPLISLNLSHQTESSDLIGGLKPVDARIPASYLQERFLDLFGATFSRRKNENYETQVRKAVNEGNWRRAVSLWKESARLARERIQAKENNDEGSNLAQGLDTNAPRKRQKVHGNNFNSPTANWSSFVCDVEEFEVQHIQGKGKFSFGFVEGPLVKALKTGQWVLLDEINLASPETLECISELLHGPTASITLTENGALEPVPRHPDFHLFACMNPATDIGKKDLPPNIRTRFTEIDVPSPDSDKDTLLSIISQYIGSSAVGDKKIIINIADFYSAVKNLADNRQIADGANHKPHFSMRTLARALTFVVDTASSYSLRRSVWEGCLMAFTMVLDSASAEVVTNLAQKYLLAGVSNPRSLLMKEPTSPHSRKPEEFVKFGPFYLEKGPLPEDTVDEYIMTPSVEKKLIDLARIILTRRFPILIEGPTSSGKTSAIEYLARRTGHRFVRINNHEHTDIQEYIGLYVSDPLTGKLVFRDGLLVQALRAGDWIVLDELNLAPTDVLEALNRLLDDNRELVIPETMEVVHPHPHFMLFATQNPPGLYAGRKVLSRAFRNRFLEVHFEDVPQAELETILCQRCRIAPSYGKRIVTVFRELQHRRQSGRVFESKHGFATLRDLFRWAGRDAIGYQELADNGYMLLAERTRRGEDKAVVKNVIESVMGVKIDEDSIYEFRKPGLDVESFIGCPIPPSSTVIWTKAMKRLYILLCRALKFNEPVLLVGETGSGKTSICQVFADATSKPLHGLNCHQNTETADLIGGLRPLRNRTATEAEVFREVADALEQLGICDVPLSPESLASALKLCLETQLGKPTYPHLQTLQRKFLHVQSIFEWHDGPLVEAMRNGHVFLLDEISLADDSVLERLNSVLEPGRTLVLAERGAIDSEHPAIRAAEGFKLVATMNPGGDYGKKELSPALRNRFTEIWVPRVDDRCDLEFIVGSLWKHDELKVFTTPVLDFVDWLCSQVGDRSLMSLRDILAWVVFSNVAYHSDSPELMSIGQIFHHAAQMTYLDGLGSLPQLSSFSRDAISRLRNNALAKLHELVPLTNSISSCASVPAHDPTTSVRFGSFTIPRGEKPAIPHLFNLSAPTTQSNAMRVVRACQVSKPILLEGSPGVGKTSLVTALANMSGHHLCRINLSDQTDLIDLFGSDLPVEGGGPGEFAWRDAEFLKALQCGHWVLLDEMNLAPQAVLEGLNAVLDHRGTVYIPELGRSFASHPSFRIFATQNPLSQGGGRKGLPKSFINRFSKVYIEELTANDLFIVCRYIFPSFEENLLRAMISFNMQLNEIIGLQRAFARDGSPWEFNLRDVVRWGTLLSVAGASSHPIAYLDTIYLNRLRTMQDRSQARAIFNNIFSASADIVQSTPPWSISATYVQFGHHLGHRKNRPALRRSGRILKNQLSALESLGNCVSQTWLAIITGPRHSGKTTAVRVLAHFTGHTLQEISINNATDTMDILGSFEQVDMRFRTLRLVQELLEALDLALRTSAGSKASVMLHIYRRILFQTTVSTSPSPKILRIASDTLSILHSIVDDRIYKILQEQLDALKSLSDITSHFEWVDGPLVQAMKHGNWLLMDGANLCNPSVLDRLNSLCETDGVLTLSERGFVNGAVQVIKPHPNFRLFMTVDPQYGELSRAMRNRGVETFLLSPPTLDDSAIIQDYLRLPTHLSIQETKLQCLAFDAARRGLTHLAHIDSSLLFSSGRYLDQDSGLASLIDQAPAVSMASHNHALVPTLLFLGRTLTPAYIAHFSRYLAFSQPESVVGCFLKLYPGANLTSLVSQLRDSFALSASVPSDFLLAQPLDFFLNLGSDAGNMLESSPHAIIVLLAELSVRLFLIERDAQHLDEEEIHASKHGLAMKGALIVLDSIKAHAQWFLAALLRSEEPQITSNIKGIISLLTYGKSLQRVIGATSFDFSAIQAIVRWIITALDDCPSSFFELRKHVQSLNEVISLSKGLGLLDIWSGFFIDNLPSFNSFEVKRIEQLSRTMQDDSVAYNYRCQAFNVLAITTLPVAVGKHHQLGMIDLQASLERCLIPPSGKSSEQRWGRINGPLLLIELSALANHDTDLALKILGEIIQLACHDINSALLRLVSYQHLIWARECGKNAIPIIIQSQIQWLDSLWNIEGSDFATGGASMLIRPTHLHTILSLCDLKNVPLLSLSDHKRDMERHLRIAQLQREQRQPRLENVTRILVQSILAIASCFESSYEANDYLALHQTTRHWKISQGSPLLQLVPILERSNNATFRSAIHKCLDPVLHRSFDGHSRAESLMHSGLCWIAVSQLIFELVVPNVPVDPAAIQNCTSNRMREDESNLLSQVQLHSHLEALSTGNESNVLLSHLKRNWKDVQAQLVSLPVLPIRNDIAQLNMYWTEVLQFQNNVLHPTKLEGLLRSLGSGEENAIRRESVVQESLAGFYQRLDTTYSTFADINSILKLAILQLRLGLRLLAQNINATDSKAVTTARLSSALVAFPSIRSASILCNDLPANGGPSTVSTSRYLLLKLSAIAMETSLGVNFLKRIIVVDSIYDQLVRLWLIDKAKERENTEASQSLYRQRNLDYNAASEAELEELDFLRLFPSFDDTADQNPQLKMTLETNSAPKTFIASIEVPRLMEIHHTLLDRIADPSLSTLDKFNNSRRDLMHSLLQTQFEALNDALDNESLPFQFSILALQRFRFTMSPNSAGKPYDFYSDSCVVELQKAVFVLHRLRNRLQEISEEFPDQMVLHHLISRCDMILNSGLESPVAMVLSALEQLLLQTEDWEMYSNRENTLKIHRQSLVELIVEWRRLELSCWRGLLESQAKIFADEISDWWFRIYDATVRGVLSASDQELSGNSDALTQYLSALVPLLDDFVTSSPLGQFEGRMRLLQSFQLYLQYLQPNKPPSQRLALERVRRVLRATERYYSLFSSQLAKDLADQRATLEKEIINLIKLASWKDINVQSLKASAQRTHHQLYKIIRKFRDVLRQPILGRLQLQQGSDADLKPLQDYPIPIYTLQPDGSMLPDCPPSAVSGHLRHLRRTFQRYNALITGHLHPFINAQAADDIDSFAIEIITTARTLSNLLVSSDIPAEKREKQQKALLVRKRKAWSDLLKELKRVGFSSNIKSEVLRQHTDVRWIREQPIMPEATQVDRSLERTEEYFSKLSASLPELRSCVATHHSDLTTRELLRGVNLLESGFSMAIDLRSRLVIAIEQFQTLDKMVRRLKNLAMAETIHLMEPVTTDNLVIAGNTLCRLSSALQDVSHGITAFEDTLFTKIEVDSLVEDVLSLQVVTDTLRDQLICLQDSFNMTIIPAVLQDESALLVNFIRHLSVATATLERWSIKAPQFSYLFEPVRDWLVSQEIPPFSRRASRLDSFEDVSEPLINSLLVGMQSLVSKCPEPVDEGAEDNSDQYILKGCKIIREFTHTLNLESILARTNHILLHVTSERHLQQSLRSIVPFVEAYVGFVRDQLVTHSRWTKAMFKLDYVLCSVMTTLSKQGFCKPPEGEDGGEGGEVSNAVGGLGLGSGSGSEDVSKEIEDESQVEGMQGDENQNDSNGHNDGEAIEMSEDFGGGLKDMSEHGSEDEAESEGDSEEENLDEHLGDLDASDPAAVDEKLWGDETGPENADQEDDKITQDHSKEQKGTSEVVAKEGQQAPKEKERENSGENPVEESASPREDEQLPEDGDDENLNDSSASGAPIDEHIQDANTLELPDDLDLGPDMDVDEVDEGQKVGEDEDKEVEQPQDNDMDGATDPDVGDVPTNEGSESPLQGSRESDDKDEEMDQPEHENQTAELPEKDGLIEEVVARPDISAGDGTADDEAANPASTETSPSGQMGVSEGGDGRKSASQETADKDDRSLKNTQHQFEAQTSGQEGSGSAGTGAQEGDTAAHLEIQMTMNPLRSLGDAMKEIQQRFNDVLNSERRDISHENTGNAALPSQVEYLQPDDADHDMQALGPAGDEQVAKLNQLTLVEDVTANSSNNMDVDQPFEEEHEQPLGNGTPLEQTASAPRGDIEGAILQSGTGWAAADASNLDPNRRMNDEEEDEQVEIQLRQWRSLGYPDEGAERIWRSYESLTHDLAFVLCEQLRLILEPTLATRLKGDYRTGKRLNMKKIISYIASDYTKDKIWLRRTKPSQREYQVLIAIDDSRSMAESHSIHLTYETLALISKALGRLEAGDIAIVKFGETVDVLHNFDEGPFTDRDGAKIMSAFKFDQKATNVLSLVDTSLKVLEHARERRSMSSSSAADLWQLEIVISDGQCQDQDKLRTVLRKAEEQRVMFVFIIIDSLHPAASDGTRRGGEHDSILSMAKPVFKNVNGKIEVELEKYLDSFPFEYYVVLRNVEALPEVLAGTLKQFFERISEE